MNGLSRTERILRVILNKQGATLPEGEPMSRVEGLLLELKDAIQEGGTTDAQIIARINTLEGEVHDDYVKFSDLSTIITDDDLTSAVSTLNSNIADCVQDDDIVILTSNQYEALESKTALLYLIPEEE